jgi:peptidoglycan/xylan/chitin deacetylase (PgdA/CDA1 family)
MLPIVAGAGVAALVTAGYNTMAPRSQLYGRTFTGGRAGSRQLALTFDDGPNDPWTLKLLEVLARHGVRATFFLVGDFVRQKPAIARAVAEAGHVIGNHTFTHPNLIFAGAARRQRELDDCERALSDHVGEHSRLFRPPFGARTPQLLREVRRRGMETVMWRVSGFDWSAESAAQIEQKIRRHLSGGEVILLHDGGHKHMGVDRSRTVSAVEWLIGDCKAAGYEFVTVAEMMAAGKAPGRYGVQDTRNSS